MAKLLETFYGDLSKLKLNQFPCGIGNWRLEDDPGYVDNRKGEVNQETLFSLEELAHSEVFNVKSDWSDNITSLRQLAVQKPHVISEAFIFQHFTTLRLVDRNINEVDRGLLKFTNLQELSLTGNCLTSVVGAHLPKSLTVLQLFANKFADLKELTISPPPNLQHLGVGYNQLTDLSSYMSPYFWPNLLSLDLSHNKIGHVMPTLQTLSQLVSLRNLSLLSNPITLAPGYRGCTLDMIPQLQILDDVSISDDDRLHFTNISGETVDWDQAILTVVFPVLENLRQPPENEALDEANFHFPAQKKYSYLIRFHFVCDLPETSSAGGGTSPVHPTASSVMPQTSEAALPGSDGVQGKVPTVQVSVPPVTAPAALSEHLSPSPASKEIEEVTASVDGDNEETVAMGGVFETEALAWESNSQFLKPVIVRCSNLPLLDEFLGGEVQFTVIEKVVESFTAIAPPDPSSPTPTSSGQKKKGGKDDKKKKKEDAAAKPLKDKDGNILKWVDNPPSYNEIANIKIALKPLLLSGATSGKMQCTVTEKPPEVTPPPEDGRASAASGKGGKGGKKGGANKKKVPTPVPVTPPEPLRMEYKVERVKWNNIQDCRVWSQTSDVPTTANQTITTAPL